MFFKSMPSISSNAKCWYVAPITTLPRPMVSARSVMMEPKLCVVLVNTPTAELKVKVKPEAGEANGNCVNCVASALFSGVKLV